MPSSTGGSGVCGILIEASACLMPPFDVSQESVRDCRSERRRREARRGQSGRLRLKRTAIYEYCHTRACYLRLLCNQEAFMSSFASAHREINQHRKIPERRFLGGKKANLHRAELQRLWTRVQRRCRVLFTVNLTFA